MIEPLSRPTPAGSPSHGRAPFPHAATLAPPNPKGRPLSGCSRPIVVASTPRVCTISADLIVNCHEGKLPPTLSSFYGQSRVCMAMSGARQRNASRSRNPWLRRRANSAASTFHPDRRPHATSTNIIYLRRIIWRVGRPPGHLQASMA